MSVYRFNGANAGAESLQFSKTTAQRRLNGLMERYIFILSAFKHYPQS